MTSPYPAVPEPPAYGPPVGPPTAGPWHPAHPGFAPVPYPGYGPGRPQGPRVANVAGIVIALVGGAVTLLGAFLDWYTDTVLGDIVNVLDADTTHAFPKAYFGWLMWVFLAATVVAALFANLPTSASILLRVVSPLLGLFGALLVLVSLGDLISGASIFDHTAIGLYLTLFGFVIAGVGGVLGPSRSRR